MRMIACCRSMMPDERDQNDDRNRNSDQPKQHSSSQAHSNVLRFASVRASARRNVDRTKVFRDVAPFRPVQGRKLRLEVRSRMDKRIALRSVFQSRAISSASGLATACAPPMTPSERSSFTTRCQGSFHAVARAGQINGSVTCPFQQRRRAAEGFAMGQEGQKRAANRVPDRREAHPRSPCARPHRNRGGLRRPTSDARPGPRGNLPRARGNKRTLGCDRCDQP
jgi:hypothetical protein